MDIIAELGVMETVWKMFELDLKEGVGFSISS